MLMVTLRSDTDHIATDCFCKTPSFVNNFTADEKVCKKYVLAYFNTI